MNKVQDKLFDLFEVKTLEEFKIEIDKIYKTINIDALFNLHDYLHLDSAPCGIPDQCTGTVKKCKDKEALLGYCYGHSMLYNDVGAKYVHLCHTLKDRNVITQKDVDRLHMYLMELNHYMRCIEMLPAANMKDPKVARNIFELACRRYLFGLTDSNYIIHQNKEYSKIIPSVIKRAIRIGDHDIFEILFKKFPNNLVYHRGDYNNTILLYANYYHRDEMVSMMVTYCINTNRMKCLKYANDFGTTLEDNIRSNGIIDERIKKKGKDTLDSIMYCIMFLRNINIF